jgi:hypothetical protein
MPALRTNIQIRVQGIVENCVLFHPVSSSFKFQGSLTAETLQRRLAGALPAGIKLVFYLFTALHASPHKTLQGIFGERLKQGTVLVQSGEGAITA